MLMMLSTGLTAIVGAGAFELTVQISTGLTFFMTSFVCSAGLLLEV